MHTKIEWNASTQWRYPVLYLFTIWIWLFSYTSNIYTIPKLLPADSCQAVNRPTNNPTHPSKPIARCQPDSLNNINNVCFCYCKQCQYYLVTFDIFHEWRNFHKSEKAMVLSYVAVKVWWGEETGLPNQPPLPPPPTTTWRELSRCISLTFGTEKNGRKRMG